MCHRLQVGATRASDARQVDYMCKRVKFYNSSGGGISTPIDAHYYLGQGSRGNTEREFIVVVKDNVYVISKDNRTADGKQSSWKLLRSRRLHRYVYHKW